MSKFSLGAFEEASLHFTSTMKDEMIVQRQVKAQVELKFPPAQPTHYDSAGGVLTELTMNHPDEGTPTVSRVFLAQGKSTLSIFPLLYVKKEEAES